MESKLSKDWKLVEVGMVVKSLDASIDYYSSTFGFGPFIRMDFKDLPVEYKNDPGVMNIKVAFCPLGELWLELIQAEPEQPFWWDFFKKHGDGLHHLCYTVKDINSEIANAKEKGIDVILHSTKGGFVLLDSNPIIELVVGDLGEMLRNYQKRK